MKIMYIPLRHVTIAKKLGGNTTLLEYLDRVGTSSVEEVNELFSIDVVNDFLKLMSSLEMLSISIVLTQNYRYTKCLVISEVLTSQIRSYTKLNGVELLVNDGPSCDCDIDVQYGCSTGTLKLIDPTTAEQDDSPSLAEGKDIVSSMRDAMSKMEKRIESLTKEVREKHNLEEKVIELEKKIAMTNTIDGIYGKVNVSDLIRNMNVIVSSILSAANKEEDDEVETPASMGFKSKQEEPLVEDEDDSDLPIQAKDKLDDLLANLKDSEEEEDEEEVYSEEDEEEYVEDSDVPPEDYESEEDSDSADYEEFEDEEIKLIPSDDDSLFSNVVTITEEPEDDDDPFTDHVVKSHQPPTKEADEDDSLLGESHRTKIVELIRAIKFNNPDLMVPSTDKAIRKACNVLERILQEGNINQKDLYSMLEWAVKDSFWKSQIISIGAISKVSNNGLHKWENIWNGWKKYIRSQVVSDSIEDAAEKAGIIPKFGE